MCPLKAKKKHAQPEPGQTPKPDGAPAYIDIESAVGIYKERIRNLEKFRDLFFETKATLIALENKSIKESITTTQKKTDDVQTAYETSNKTIASLASTLSGLEAKDGQQQRTIEKQLSELETLKRNIDESNTCIDMLQTEIDQLVAQNNHLKQTLGHTPEPDNQDITDNSDRQEPADQATQSQIAEQAKRIQQLEEELSHTTNMAFTAMRSNADIGTVIHFLVESFKTQDMQALSNLVFNTLENYHLKSMFERTNSAKPEQYHRGKKPDIDLVSTLKSCHTKGKIVELNEHLVLNTPAVRLIVKGFNKDDLIAYNNLKDNLQILILGIDSNIDRIQAETNTARERQNLEKLVITTHRALENIGKKQKNESAKVHNLAIESMNELKSKINKLNLTAEQRALLLKSIQEKMSKIESLVESEVLVDQSFVQIINSLKESISKKSQPNRPNRT